MTIYQCNRCKHKTNATFVDAEDRCGNGITVVRCAGRFVRDREDVVERGCAYDRASTSTREQVDRTIEQQMTAAPSGHSPCITRMPTCSWSFYNVGVGGYSLEQARAMVPENHDCASDPECKPADFESAESCADCGGTTARNRFNDRVCANRRCFLGQWA